MRREYSTILCKLGSAFGAASKIIRSQYAAHRKNAFSVQGYIRQEYTREK